MNIRGEPVALDSGYLDLAPGGGGKTADSELLNNTFAVPIVIDELRFITRYFGAVGMPNQSALNGSMRVRIRFGPYEITNGFIPVWSFGPVISDAGSPSAFASPEYCVSGDPDVDEQSTVYAHFRWPLPKPLFARPGDGLIVDFQRTIDGFSAGGSMLVAAAGRRMPAGTVAPAEIDVPYVTSWQSPFGSVAAVSSEYDLWNKFDYPIYVQQFTARMWNWITGDTSRDEIEALVPSTSVTPSPSITMNVIKLGPPPDYQPHTQTIIRDPMPIGCAFDVNRRVWVIGKTLDKKEGFQIKLAANAGGMNNRSLHMGMIGYRKERVF